MTLENSRTIIFRPHAIAYSRDALWATVAGVLLTLAFCAYYLGQIGVASEADPRLLAEFQGQRPEQLRILLPYLLHLGTSYLGLDVMSSCRCLIVGFSLGLFFVFRLYLAEFCTPRAAQWLALGIVPPLFVFYSHHRFYLYDIPATFFATLGLLLIAQKRWGAYLAAFLVATLNRESSLFILLAFVLTMRRTLQHRHFLWLLAAQTGIWLLVRGVLMSRFATQSGEVLKFQFLDNVSTLVSYLTHWSAPLNFMLAVWTLVCLWCMGTWTQAVMPPFLRRARGVVLPFLILMSVVGVLSETWLYGELLPVLLAPALIGLFNWSWARLHIVETSPSSCVL